MKALLTTVSAALCLTLTVAAVAPTPRHAPARPEEQLDYLYLASDQPVLLRFHLLFGDRPYTALWSDYMDKLFAWFDKNGDGSLDAIEVAALPAPQSLFSQLQGSISAPSSRINFNQLDTDRDGRISPAEFKNYYRANVRPLQFSTDNSPASFADQVNQALYQRLDRNKDGRLSEEELSQLPKLLAMLDENEDELLSTTEISPTQSGASYAESQTPPMLGSTSAPTSSQGLIELPASEAGKRYANTILSHYDRNRDGKLSRKEIGFSAQLFDQLDKNKDEQLDTTELAAWFERQPDLVFRLRVGPLGAVAGVLDRIQLPKKLLSSTSRVELLASSSNPSPLADRVQRIDSENVQFQLGDTRVQLQSIAGQTASTLQRVRDFFQRLYDVLEGEKGYVAKEQEKDSRQQPFLFQIFAQADKNSDGKLTREELTAWLDLLGEGNAAHVRLQVSDLGRGLFAVLDSDASGSLSLRELRSAWARVQPYTKSNQGVAVSDLPRTLKLVAGQGNFLAQQALVRFGAAPPPPVSDRPAPLWFRKMDRNRDNDISPREWLGTEEEFRRLDTDGDGLISLEEARKFDEQQKSVKR